MEYRDLKRQYASLKPAMDAAMQQVCMQANFISGKEVFALEARLAAYVGVEHCMSCANGTDALSLVLQAWGIGAGDAVFVPDFTFFSSGEVVADLGATPLFVDVDARTYNLDADCLERAITAAQAQKTLRPRAVIAVDLFGLCADYSRIAAICKRHGLLLLEDGAQGFGASLNGRRACSFGDAATTSFFPAKPLGCYGDGGAVFTNDSALNAMVRSLAVHGKGENKYDNVRLGRNSRLDTLQAAVLSVKLTAFEEYELKNVGRAAAWYDEALDRSGLVLPMVPTGYTSSWAQYTVQLPPHIDRAALQAALREQGVPTLVYYCKPMHRQQAFANTQSAKADCPVTDHLCGAVLSLPIHPYLTREEVGRVAEALERNLTQEKQ